MTKITIYSEDRKITGENLFIKIIGGIQCIYKDTSNTYYDKYLYTTKKLLFRKNK